MRIKLDEIEQNLPYNLKRNFKSIGIDTAQITGIVTLETDQNYLYVTPLVLSFKTKDHKEIYGTMVRTFEKIFETEQFGVIEEVFVGFNRAGSVELAKYGAFAISECIKKNMEYNTISAVSARSKWGINTRAAGKGKSKEAVGKWLEDNLGSTFNDDNINDAMVLALCGIAEDFDFTVVKKTRTRKKTTKKKTIRKKTTRKRKCKRKNSKK